MDAVEAKLINLIGIEMQDRRVSDARAAEVAAEVGRLSAAVLRERSALILETDVEAEGGEDALRIVQRDDVYPAVQFPRCASNCRAASIRLAYLWPSNSSGDHWTRRSAFVQRALIRRRLTSIEWHRARKDVEVSPWFAA